MTAIEKYIKELEGLKTGNKKMETVVQAFIERAKEYLPIEKQDLQRAFNFGVDEGIKNAEDATYEPKTFDQFYNELKGE